MRTTPNQERHWHKESGQSMIITVLALGLFLLGAAGFGVDVANLWYHRQAAQTAADAACTAGAMDMLYSDVGEPTPAAPAKAWNWMTGVASGTVDCGNPSSNFSTYAPCWYAAQNGYSSGT